MEENKYQPLTIDEFNEMKGIVDSIGVNLPEHLLPYIWDKYNALRGKSEPRPCSCQSAASHWIGAINYLRDWIKQKA